MDEIQLDLKKLNTLVMNNQSLNHDTVFDVV